MIRGVRDGDSSNECEMFMGRIGMFCKAMIWVLGCAVLTLVCLSSLARAAEQNEEVLELRPLAAGVTLPVAVGRTLRAGKAKPGTVVVMKTTQRVPVSEDSYLKRGAAVRGEVVTSDAGDRTAAHPATLTIRFMQLSYR